MDEDFNWFVVHVFDTVGHSPCVTCQILCDCCGCLVWALAPFFVLLDLRVVGLVGFSWLFVCDDLLFFLRPLCFMLVFNSLC